MRFKKPGTRFANFDEVMRSAPGPSPWYFRREPPDVAGHSGPFHWSDASVDFPRLQEATGKILLRDPAGRARLIFDFHCYARQAHEGHLLCWYAVDDSEASVDDAFIHLWLFDVDSLPVLDDLPDLFVDMGQKRSRMWPQQGEIAHAMIPLTLADGTHTIRLPDPFQSLDEILILGHAVRNGRRSTFDDEMYLCLYIVRPAEHTIAVMPQDWFNRAGLDYSYQWVTRVARDPQTQRIFGEGIRIRSFVLAPDGRHVDVWR